MRPVCYVIVGALHCRGTPYHCCLPACPVIRLRALNPRCTARTGSWFIFFEIIGYTAVLTNLGVVVFTTQSSFFGIDTPYEKLVVFVVIEVRGVARPHMHACPTRMQCCTCSFRTSCARAARLFCPVSQHFLFGLKFIVSQLIADEPALVTQGREREV